MKKRLAYNPYRVKPTIRFALPDLGSNVAIEQTPPEVAPKPAIPPVRPEAGPMKSWYPPARPEVGPRGWSAPALPDANARALMVRVPPSKQSDFSATRFCGKCGSRDLRDDPASLLQKCLLLRPYTCLLCSTKQRRFKFSGFVLVTLMLIGGLSYAGVYLYKNPPAIFAESEAQNSADALARSRSNGLSAYEAMMLKKPRTTLDNASILRLWKANVGASVIIKMIQTSNPDYDLNANAVIELQQAGVDQTIIVAMIDATYATR